MLTSIFRFILRSLILFALTAPVLAADTPEDASTLAEKVLAAQTGFGGWPAKGDKSFAPKASMENGATVNELRLMARMFRQTQDARYLRAVENGVDFLLVAQHASGGWPQVYPPTSTVQRYIDFGGGSMLNVVDFLREAVTTDTLDFLDAGRRQAMATSLQRGLECILKCQVLPGKQPTAWGTYHEETELTPRRVQAGEVASRHVEDSVKVLRLLMSLDRPSPRLVHSIEAATEWLESVRITGQRIVENPELDETSDRNFQAIPDPAAEPVWARTYDIASNRPVFYDYESKGRLGLENIGWASHGSIWLGPWAQSLLETDYPAWKRKLAMTGPGPEPAEWTPRMRIALAGDSTVTDGAGWGFGFKKALSSEVLCQNFAAGGQSSKSFRETGLWERALACQPDYVLIQFGHNDMPGKGPHRETDPATTYPENLTRFIAEARAAGAKPILVTSLTRRIFLEEGKLRGELAPWVEAMKKVAARENVPLIDLYTKSVELVEKLGPAGVDPYEPKILAAPRKPATVVPSADIDLPPPTGQAQRDATHLNALGSIEFGRIIAQEMARVAPETAGCFRN